MNALKDYVNWKLTHADKTAEAEGYPLTMENCKKNKRMKQLEIYGNSVQEGTPTPDNPVEVQSVGVKSVNLFDKDNPERKNFFGCTNIKSTDTGISFIVNGTYGYIVYKIGDISNFLNKTITFNSPDRHASSYSQLLVCDSNNTRIREGSSYSTLLNGLYYSTITITESDCVDGGYLALRLYFGGSPEVGSLLEFRDIMVAESNTPLPYEPFGKYKIPVVQRGINLFSMAKAGLEPQTINGITFTPLDDERIHIKGKAIDTTIKTIYKPLFKTKIPIGVGIYNLKISKPTSELTQMIAVFKDSNTFIINLNTINTNQSITQEGAKLWGIYLSVNAGSTREWDDIVELQVTKGTDTKSLPYEPYIEPITTNVFLNEPLRKIGDYADYIDGKGDKVVRTIKEHIITGTETVLPFSGANPYNFINIGDPGYVIDDICLCNSFAHQSNFSISREGVNTFRVFNSYSNNASRIAFRLYVDGAILNNENKVRPILKNRYQSGNPVIFYYGLSEPLEESITNDLPKLNAKTTIIEVDTSLAPSNAKGKYIKK